MQKNEVIYSSDVNLVEHANFISFKDGTCIFKQYDYDKEVFIVHTFDVLDEIPSWVDLKGINESCDTNYTEGKEIDFNIFTMDVCWYYGAYEFDYSPSEMNEEEIEILINSILEN